MVHLRLFTASAARHCLLIAAIAMSATCGSKTPTQPDPTPSTGGQGQNQGQNQQPTLTGVSVTSPNNAITVGQSEQFTATANFSNNTTQNVTSTATWSSTNNGVATVSSSGAANGVSAGTAEIRATFQGANGSKSLQVNAAANALPVARFVVTGPGGSNVCRIIENSNGDWDCRFDGSASTGGTGGNVVRWRWRFDVGANGSSARDENDPILEVNPGCGFFTTLPNAQPGTSFVQVIVKLEVRNAAGIDSAEERNANVRLFPQKQCGFGF